MTLFYVISINNNIQYGCRRLSESRNRKFADAVTPGGRGAATKKAEWDPAAMLPLGQIVLDVKTRK